ncbi:hypothetical protein [Roseimicrobium sp. ORNL1]|uniref:hypothetical protein n=1 Tax=Roseimicrobium sp. ORNL1 TaxID=2711231 RepID=UPI0013E13C19|nr:hypothetical protein [Roseimicrobium sp. ORNL1]QIF04955.1 hypothetical protein G5S37_26710 [Roseimicrobium sp. ORNL1]
MIEELSGPCRKHFAPKNYGEGLSEIVVVLMCQDSALNLKRRLRYSRKESKVYMDIMLDLPAMSAATPEARKQEVMQRLFDEVPEVLERYRIPDFDREVFVADLRSWIAHIGWRERYSV